MAGRYGVTVVNATGALEGPRFTAVCRWPECGWASPAHVVKVAAEDDARAHRHKHRQTGSATTAGLLLFLIFGALAWLAVLHVGQQAMCALHDQQLRYCAGWTPTTSEENP